MLGVHEWEGLYPFAPEAWLIPQQLPIHPSRMWCFARQVYMSMCWLYGHRAVTVIDPLLREIRSELYPVPYDDVDWIKNRGTIAECDSRRPRSRVLKVAFAALNLYEAHPSRVLRARAMDSVLDHIDHENRNSNYVGNGPIPKFLDTLVWHFARPDGDEIASHVKRLPDYLWDAADGTRVQCYNSCETWDTAFAVQALVESRHSGPCAARPDTWSAIRN